jgi:hypothetical protein
VWSPSAQVVVAVALTGIVLGAAWRNTHRAESS